MGTVRLSCFIGLGIRKVANVQKSTLSKKPVILVASRVCVLVNV